MNLKGSVYEVAKSGGLFKLTERLTRGHLPILCYHGFAFSDEHLFRPGLFHSTDVFERRLSFLKAAGYSSVPLDEAVSRLHSEKLEAMQIVLTIDDGFYSVLDLAAPILADGG